METATFGAGCFWGVEAAFRSCQGVVSTSVGYMGGHFENPSYLDVVSRITGHAEVCQVEYEPSVVSYEVLLDIFSSQLCLSYPEFGQIGLVGRPLADHNQPSNLARKG